MKRLNKGKLFIDGAFQTGKTLLIAGGKIEKIIPSTEEKNGLDLTGKYILPGLIDLQLNGGGGCFFANDISVEGIRQIHRTHLNYGTTSFLITLTTSKFENIFKAIEVVKEYQKIYPGLLGLHVEGPYLNPIKKGAHPLEFIRKPSIQELKDIIEAGKGIIKILTIAPEIFSEEAMQLLRASGITLSAGHSEATYAQAEKGFQQGISLVTHLYNAMSQLGSRAPGLVGATLNHPEIWSSIIVDGKHCDYAAIELAYKLKKERLVLISDAAFKDEEGDSFQFGSTKVTYKDGFYYTQENRLAGSSISMYEAVLNSTTHANIPFEEAIKMASSKPAKIIQAAKVGSIKEGNNADLLILNKDLSIYKIFINGEAIKYKARVSS